MPGLPVLGVGGSGDTLLSHVQVWVCQIPRSIANVAAVKMINFLFTSFTFFMPFLFLVQGKAEFSENVLVCSCTQTLSACGVQLPLCARLNRRLLTGVML